MFAYNENTISDQIHTKWAGKPSILQKKRILQICGSSALAKEGAPQGTFLPLQNFSLQEEDVLDAPGRYRKEPP